MNTLQDIINSIEDDIAYYFEEMRFTAGMMNKKPRRMLEILEKIEDLNVARARLINLNHGL